MTSSVANIGALHATPIAMASDGRASITNSFDPRRKIIWAKKVFSFNATISIRSTVAPSSSITVANRSCVCGRSTLHPLRRRSIAHASVIPITIGNERVPPTSESSMICKSTISRMKILVSSIWTDGADMVCFDCVGNITVATNWTRVPTNRTRQLRNHD